MGGNVFWIESNLTEHTIKVKSIFGTGDRVLSKFQSYSQPAHLVLYPEKRSVSNFVTISSALVSLLSLMHAQVSFGLLIDFSVNCLLFTFTHVWL